VLGAFRLIQWSRQPAIAVFASGLILTQFWLPGAHKLVELRSEINPRTIRTENSRFRKTEEALRGERIFSTVPRLALLDPHPALMEPYLLSYMERLKKINPEPILNRIRRDDFDVVITPAVHNSYRGVLNFGSDIATAIVQSYAPYCELHLDKELLLFLPRNRPQDPALVDNLRALDCIPYPAAGDFPWKSERK
jgi:hypothetical protein